MSARAVALASIVVATLCASAAAQEPVQQTVQTPAHVGRRDESADDRRAIEQVTLKFREALSAKDTRALAELFVDGDIDFVTPPSPKRQLELAAQAASPGWTRRGAASFLAYVEKATTPIDERFYNLRINQDGHLAWVMFDFEFVEDGKVENHGLEVWQMLKTADARWKILSVVWSSHGAPKPGR